MSKVKDYLFEYAKICLGLENNPRGLEHNTEFQSFVANDQSTGLLIGYDEKSNSFVVGGEGKLDAYFHLWKQEGSLATADLPTSLNITIASDLNDLKELLTDQLKTSVEEGSSSSDALEQQLLSLVKEDLHTDPDYLRRVKAGHLHTILTFEDEARIQAASTETARIGQNLSRIVSYTDPSKELTGAQVDSSIKEVVSCFRDLLKPQEGRGIPQDRALHLIQLYADKLFREAHKENSQLDLFDYENCNLRLKLALWKDILKQYQVEIEELAKEFKLNVEPIFSGAYSDYIKKLTSANYLRGIYDELIRFCKYHNLTECDKKLQSFNEVRKDEKMSAKQERDTFFKEFSTYLMNIVEYVDKEILPMLESKPIEALVEVKKWNNILNYRKNTPEVKKIREAIADKIPQISDHIQQSLATLSKQIDQGSEFIRKWKEAQQQYINLKTLVSLVLEGQADEAVGKLAQHQEKFDSLIKKFCTKLEDDLSQFRSKDQIKYEQAVSRRVAVSLEDELYCFLSPSQKSDEISDILTKIKQSKLENNYSTNFKQEAEEILNLKDIVIQMKQTLQQFTFNVERVDESLLDVVKNDATILELIKCLKDQIKGDHLCLNSLSEGQAFFREVKEKTEDAVNKLKAISGAYKTSMHSIQFLSGFKLFANQSFWRSKIQERNSCLI